MSPPPLPRSVGYRRKPRLTVKPHDCVYCGAPTTGRACADHRRLLLLDPVYTLARRV